MEVRKGYKQTEVGIIPEDWKIQSLGQVVTFLDGQRRPVKDTDRAKMSGEIPYYGASGIVDYVNDYLFDEDLILLGEDGENILSRNTRLAFRVSGKIWVNNHAHVLRPNPDTSIGFLTDYLEALNYEHLNSGTAQPKLNKQNCFGIPIALPPTLAEQEAIAEALSDADALIEAIEQLIAKKRQIKQGAMSELLMGKRRLAGFDGKWEVKRLGEVLTLRYGKGQKDIIVNGGKFPIIATSGEVGRTNQYLYDKPSVIIGRKGTIDKPQYIDVPFWTIDTAYYSEISKQGNPKFLFYLLTTFDWYSYNEASGVPSLNAKTVENIEISLPTLPEQTAIAEILSDMDAEITALEGKLVKARQVKAGMMSELLTGKIRLVSK
jgi:type I restriction enzyme S subunit